MPIGSIFYQKLTKTKNFVKNLTCIYKVHTFTPMKQEVLIIRIENGTKKQLKKAAENSNRSMSDYTRLILEQAIANKTKV